MESERLFVAVRPPEEAIQAAFDVQQALIRRLGDRAFRWVARGNFHVTLHFFGETQADRIPAVEEALVSAVASWREQSGGRISARLSQPGAFPSPARARTLWIGIDDGGGLASLQQIVCREIAGRNFPLERRRFKPHLTIGYARRNAERQATEGIGSILSALAPEAVEFELNGLVLVRSVLGGAGATYSDRLNVPLAE